MDIERLLDIIEDFEEEWFSEHSSLYTDSHHAEYRQAKQEYIEESIRAAEEVRLQRIEDYENDPEVQYGWHQQDMIDMYRRER